MPTAPTFDLFRLQVFITVVHRKSLTGAGLQLGLPQPVVSRHLARLEADFGGRLFERHGRGVKLSELGLRMFPKIENLLRDAGELAEEIDKGSNYTGGEARIGILPSLRALLTVPLFFQMQQTFPLIRLSLWEGSGHQIDQWLANGEIDIGLPYRYGRYADQQLDPLVSFNSYLVGPAGDALTRNATVSFCQLANLPLILPAAPSDFRLKLDQIAKQKQISLNVIMEAESGTVQRDIVALRGGYTVSTWHAIANYLERGDVQASEIIDPVICRSISLGFPATKSASRAVKAVAATIKEIMDSKSVRNSIQRLT
jgi:LysR family nitrogen assimilation transcriptional regulator